MELRKRASYFGAISIEIMFCDYQLRAGNICVSNKWVMDRVLCCTFEATLFLIYSVVDAFFWIFSNFSAYSSKQRWGLTWTATVPYRNRELYTENTHKNFFPNKTNWISIPYDIIFGQNEFVPCCFIIVSCKLAVDGKYWTDSHLMHINWRRDIVM